MSPDFQLSYIASSVCGHPDVKVFDTLASPPTVLSAPEVIAKYGLPTIALTAKEGLGLINGTAVSCAAGTLALYDAECLAVMSQTATAMTVEACKYERLTRAYPSDIILRSDWTIWRFRYLHSRRGPPSPWVHRMRSAHAKSSKHVHTVAGDEFADAGVQLEGSQLAIHEEEELELHEDVGILRQDRYALRTSPQWIGPQLEQLALARQQISIELNSTTDNPLFDIKRNKTHHTGAFQAMAVTSAMDSTRIALQNLGKLAFAQVTELVK